MSNDTERGLKGFDSGVLWRGDTDENMFSHVFEVTDRPRVLKAINLPCDVVIKLEMGHSGECDTVWGPYIPMCDQASLSACGNVLAIVPPGIYRLVVEAPEDTDLVDVRVVYTTAPPSADLSMFQGGSDMGCGSKVNVTKDADTGCVTIVVDNVPTTFCEGDSVSCDEQGVIINGELCPFPDGASDTSVVPGSYAVGSSGVVQVPLENGNTFSIDITGYSGSEDIHLATIDDSNPGVVRFLDNNGGLIDTLNVSSVFRVYTDSTISGDGTVSDPLHVDHPPLNFDGGTLVGSGTADDPFRINPDIVSGSGTSDDPYTIGGDVVGGSGSGVFTDATISGDGTAGDPLHVDHPPLNFDDGTLVGSGTVDDPFRINPDIVSGSGTPTDPYVIGGDVEGGGTDFDGACEPTNYVGSGDPLTANAKLVICTDDGVKNTDIGALLPDTCFDAPVEFDGCGTNKSVIFYEESPGCWRLGVLNEAATDPITLFANGGQVNKPFSTSNYTWPDDFPNAYTLVDFHTDDANGTGNIDESKIADNVIAGGEFTIECPTEFEVLNYLRIATGTDVSAAFNKGSRLSYRYSVDGGPWQYRRGVSGVYGPNTVAVNGSFNALSRSVEETTFFNAPQGTIVFQLLAFHEGDAAPILIANPPPATGFTTTPRVVLTPING